ncbi:hypothetical protein WMF31_31335 [Sorangium sp. So ce1036]
MIIDGKEGVLAGGAPARRANGRVGGRPRGARGASGAHIEL